MAAERLHPRFFGEQINLEAGPVEHLEGTGNIEHVTVVIDWDANDHGVPLRAHSCDLLRGRSLIEGDLGSIAWTGDVWRTLPRTGGLSRRVGRGALRRETGTCEADEAPHTEQQDRFFASQKRHRVL